MSKNILRVLMIQAFLLLFSIALAAQENPEEGPEIDEYLATPYTLGDQMISFHFGATLPLFNFAPSSGDFIDPNLNFGGGGAFEWMGFLNSSLAVGGSISGSFMGTASGDTLILVPVTLAGSWIFQVYPFDIPVFLNTGICFTKKDSDLFVGPVIKAGSGFYWNMDSTWAFGMKLSYIWLPVFYGPDSNRRSLNRIGNYLDIHLGAIYHF